MSLPETAVDAAICPKCDAEVRDGSVFCYNCGGRVVEDESAEQPVDAPKIVDEPSSKPAPGLRTARDIRRRERSIDRKPKEVVWEAADSNSDFQLIIVTVGIIVFTLAVIVLIRYLG